MAQANYARCLANTLVEEGGYSNHPNDPGGPTMRGVIQRVYDDFRDKKGMPRQHVRNITEAELQEIYRTGYANPIDFDNWPKGPDQIAFDICVNSGKGNAVKIMGRALGVSTTSTSQLAARARSANDHAAVVKATCGKRGAFYQSLRTFASFGKGWMRRNARMEALGVKMALEARNTSPAAADGVLKRERDDAKGSATKNATGAGTTATAGGGAAADSGTGGTITGVPLEPSAWGGLEWAVAVIVVAGGLLLLWYFISKYRQHRERSKAYEAARSGSLDATLAHVTSAIKGG